MKRVWNKNREYEPPEMTEPEYIDSVEEFVIPLDAYIIIDKDGSWEYEDEEYSWAKNPDSYDEAWWSESDQYDSIRVCDYNDVVERTDELLESLLPFGSGRYHIKGDVKLVFEVRDIEIYSKYKGRGYHDEEVIDEYSDASNADIEFIYDKSSIDNFEIDKI